MRGISPSVIIGVGIAVLALVISGVIIGIGSTIVQGVATTQIETRNIINETINFAVNGTYYPFTYKSVQIVLNITNNTHQLYNNASIQGNWSYNSSYIRMQSNFGVANYINVGTYNVTYTINRNDTPAYLTSMNVSSGILNASAQFPLLGTIIAMGAIITILLAIFAFRKGGI